MHALRGAALALLVPFVLAVPTAAQNFVPNGDFEQGSTGWSLTSFNDPAGKTGFGLARTTGNGPSNAVFADFQTLTSVRSATYGGPTIMLPPAPIPVSFNAMWDKQQTAPVPQPTVNRVELRIYDATTNARVFLGTLQSPNQTGMQERASFSNTFNVPAAGMYRVELFLRHSNLAGIPFTNWVDDVVVGAPVSFVFGSGCAGAGSAVPVLDSINVPALGTTNYAIELHDALAPAPALFALDATRTSWRGVKLPFALGGGCDVHVGLTILLSHVTSGTGSGMGTATQTLPIPNNPTLRGAQLFAQWLVHDTAAANPFQLATTAGFAFTIQ